MNTRYLTLAEAQAVGKQLGVEWTRFDDKQFWMGLNLELQRGWLDSTTHITNADPVATARLVLSKLDRIPDYYTRLGRMLQQAGRTYGTRFFIHRQTPVATQ